MAPKPKAGSTKKKAAKRPKIPAKEQSERFIETARELGIDGDGKRFEQVFRKIVPPKGANR